MHDLHRKEFFYDFASGGCSSPGEKQNQVRCYMQRSAKRFPVFDRVRAPAKSIEKVKKSLVQGNKRGVRYPDLDAICGQPTQDLT